MAKAKKYGYYKPITPNGRAWYFKRRPRPRDPKTRKEDADGKTVGKQFGPA